MGTIAVVSSHIQSIALLVYVVLTGALAAAGWGFAHSLRSERRDGIGTLSDLGDPTDPVLLARLAGGPRLAVYAAAAELRAAGALAANAPARRTRTRELVVDGSLPAGVTPLARTLYAHVADGGGSRGRMLRPVERSQAMARLTREAQDDGLLVDPERTAPLTRWALAQLAPVLVTVALLTVDVAAHGVAGSSTPTAWVFTAGWVLNLIIALSFLRPRLLWTDRGQHLVDQTRRREETLRRKPPTPQLALAVALFGRLTLLHADPAFGAALGIREPD
jgi:uncharacterized protein (TIGR04222 family)